MKKQDFIQLHKLLAFTTNYIAYSHPSQDFSEVSDEAVRPEAEEIFNLSDYRELETKPVGIDQNKKDHKKSVLSLANSISDAFEEGELDEIELDLNYEESETGTPDVPITPDELEEKNTEQEPEDDLEQDDSLQEVADTLDPEEREVERMLNSEVEVETQEGEVIRGEFLEVDERLNNYLIDTTGYSDRGLIQVGSPEAVIPEDREGLEIRALDPRNIQESPFASKEFDAENLSQYIRTVEENNGLKSVPVVRPKDENYEVVDGHKGTFVAEQAKKNGGLDSQMFIVREMSDWEAAVTFVEDHIPGERDYDLIRGGWYDDEEVKEAIYRLQERFGEDVLELDRVRYHVDRFQDDLKLNTPAEQPGIEDDREPDRISEPEEVYDEDDEIDYAHRLVEEVDFKKLIEDKIEEAAERHRLSEREKERLEAKKSVLAENYRDNLRQEVEDLDDAMKLDLYATLSQYGELPEPDIDVSSEVERIMPDQLALSAGAGDYIAAKARNE